MRIAVIADTHDCLPEKVCTAIAGADEIWHLGDVCSEAVLDRIRAIGPLVRWVRGNCDFEEAWPLRLNFELTGRRFHMEHIPTNKPPRCDFFLHGHTHVPRDETIRGVRFLNPGCITRPNRGEPASYAWLMLEQERVSWELVLV